MKRILCLAAVLIALAGPHELTAAEGRYTRSMFAHAVKKDSSRYALLQVQNPRTSATRTVCVRGGSIVAALAIENGWTYGVNGMGKATHLAVKYWNRPFAFENANAVAKVQPRYTPNQVALLRGAMGRFSNAELRAQLRQVSRRRKSGEMTELQRMCAGHDTPIAYASRDAVAHVLLERGILVAQDERTGHLRLP